jgi:chromosome segregation ATPase
MKLFGKMRAEIDAQIRDCVSSVTNLAHYINDTQHQMTQLAGGIYTIAKQFKVLAERIIEHEHHFQQMTQDMLTHKTAIEHMYKQQQAIIHKLFSSGLDTSLPEIELVEQPEQTEPVPAEVKTERAKAAHKPN